METFETSMTMLPVHTKILKRRDLTAVQKFDLMLAADARIEQRGRNLRLKLSEPVAAVQESYDMTYMKEHGELPPPEWLSPVVLEALMQPA